MTITGTLQKHFKNCRIVNNQDAYGEALGENARKRTDSSMGACLKKWFVYLKHQLHHNVRVSLRERDIISIIYL